MSLLASLNYFRAFGALSKPIQWQMPPLNLFVIYFSPGEVCAAPSAREIQSTTFSMELSTFSTLLTTLITGLQNMVHFLVDVIDYFSFFKSEGILELQKQTMNLESPN